MTKDLSSQNSLGHIARKEDVWHLIRRGILTQIHFDLETYGLEREFSQIASYGDAVGDIAGNMIDSAEIHIKRPDRYLPSPASLLVTRTSISELEDEGRDPHRIGMAKIAQRFDTASTRIGELPLERHNVHFTTVRKKGEDKYEKEFEEEVIEYPLKDEKGNVVNHVRYHPERNMMAYRFDEDPASPYYDGIENNYYVGEDGAKWKFVEPSVLVSGYRIKWADNNWLRPNLVKAGFHPSNIFFTHSRSTITNKQKPKNFAVDTYSANLNTYLFGPGGEEGIRLSSKIDPRTGERVASATLSRVMVENTRYEDKQRGVREGVRMPDGTLYDPERAHRSPAYDAQASFALYNYDRSLAPDVIRDMELQADERELRRILPGASRVDREPPIHGLLRNDYPYAPTADPAVFLGFDDQLGQLRRAIMVRLDADLRTYTWRGKALPEMDVREIVAMIKDQSRRPDAIINPLPVRRWPGVVGLEKAMRSGAGASWDMDQVIDNFQFLIENEPLCNAIREAVAVINWEIHNRSEPANPLMEEQWTRNGFGDLDFYEREKEIEKFRQVKTRPSFSGGEVPSIVELVYNKAVDVYNYHNAIDELLHRIALQPHPVEYSDGPEALQNFQDLLRRAKKRLDDKGSPYGSLINLARVNVMTPEDAREFRWSLMKRFLADDEKQRQDRHSRFGEGVFDNNSQQSGRVIFANLSRDFHVVDQSGRELSMEYMKNQYAADPNTVIKKLENREWRVEFYRLSSEPSITATLFQFADMDRLEEMDQVWQERYKALKHLYLNGAPNEDPSQMRWPCIPSIEQDLTRIEVNTRINKNGGVTRVFSHSVAGEGEIFAGADESQRIIAEYKAFIERIKQQESLAPREKQLLQYDPESGVPYDRIQNTIPSGDFIIIRVPDDHLRNPLRDVRMGPLSLIVEKLPEEQRRAISTNAPVIFEGEQTGRLYFGGPVNIKKAPSENGSYSDYLEQARRAYENGAGVKFPDAGNRDVLVIEKLYPVANSRPDMDISLQTVKVPDIYFDGLTCPRLAHFPGKKPFTGLVLPVDYCPQKLEEGKAIRFREMNAPLGAKLTGDDGPETGNTYESARLLSAERVTVQELYDRIAQGRVTDKFAESCGFGSAFDMWEKIHQSFLDQESPDPNREEIFLLTFKPVNKRSWAWFDPPEVPEAAITYNEDRTVPPSAYRPVAPPANDNGAEPPSAKADNRAGPSPS